MHIATDYAPLEVQREAFARNRFLAMPLAGAIVWGAVLVAGLLLPQAAATWVLFIATGSIAWLGMGLSKLTGEDFFDKTRPKNAFDSLFFHGMGQAMLAFGIAVPFALVDINAAAMGFGIVAGLMWVPMSWILRHWIGWFHAVARTLLVVAAWFLFPGYQLLAVPLVIIAVYIVTIVVMERRWRAANAPVSVAVG